MNNLMPDRQLNWSGKRDLNSRPSPWQGDALPLSYSRSITVGARGGILLSRNETVKRPEQHNSPSVTLVTIIQWRY